MTPPRVDVVLVRPARAANVAAACRALKNMGLGAPRLVSPRCDPRVPGARASAYGAWDVLDAVSVWPDLAQAVGDAELVVAASARTGEPAWSPRELAAHVHAPDGRAPRRVAVVFGPEDHGLSTLELAACHRLVRIPTHASHSSLNLAQAVLVVAYELFVARPGTPAEPAPPAATAAELEAGLAHLKAGLLELGFLDPQNPEPLLAECRRLLARAGITRRELSWLRGLARQMTWAGGVARGRRRGR